MLNNRNLSKESECSLFQNPTKEYRGIPFWSWNCKITKELIDEQLIVFKQMGFGGVNIHPRAGMETEYLSEEYMELVAYAAKRCKELGLYCWLYDEDRFPSGSAGGFVTKNFRFRGRFLLLTEEKKSVAQGFYPNREAFEAAIDRGEKPAGYYIAMYLLTFEREYLTDYKRIENELLPEISENQRIRYAYVKVLEEEAWFENQTNVDYLNPEAIAEFIKITHERYEKYVGEEFGKTVPAIFTDEPRMGKYDRISTALSKEDVALPYSDYLAELMLEQYKTDVLDIAPEYIWERMDGYSVNRYRYRNMAAEAFVRSFMDQICDWCNEHGIAMAGHVLGEETLTSQTHLLGECMRCYRKMDIPGIDILVDGREFANAKQAVSVARQNGKQWTLSELYGSTNWDCDFKTYKLQGDWQAALGITLRVPHLSHMSLQGEAKRDWPASIFSQSPWYAEYSYLEDYFARLNTVLTRGRALVNIGVIHPVESMWMVFGPMSQTEEIRKKLDSDFEKLVHYLLYSMLDFDFISESLLPEQCDGNYDYPDKTFRVGQMAYQAIVVPNMITIRSTTLERLERFQKAGGTVIFLGQIPELVDGCKSDRAEKLALLCNKVPFGKEQLQDALECVREINVEKLDKEPAKHLFYQLREDNQCRWLFICHADRKTEEPLEAEEYQIWINGSYRANCYNLHTGEVSEAECECCDGKTRIPWCMYAEDSVLLRLDEISEEPEKQSVSEKRAEKKAEKFETITVLEEVGTVCREEWNALLLDYAKYRLDKGEIHEKEEILRLDNKLREQLGFVIRQDRMNQPWFLKEKEQHQVTLFYEFTSEISTEGYLAVEHPEHCRIFLNDVEADRTVVDFYVDKSISMVRLPEIIKGKNEIRIQVEYHQKTNLENMYVLGDFDVDLVEGKPVICRKRTTISLGDITGQGMFFYTGNLRYVFRFEISEETEYYVQISDFKAPVLSVEVDGNKRGLIAYAPHRQSLGVLTAGQHELVVCLFGNRFNGFGALHNAVEKYKWCGPDSYRTKNEEWTAKYLVRPVGIMSAPEIQKKLS